MAFLPTGLICRRLLSRSSFWSRSVVHTHRLSTTTKPTKIQNPSFPSPWLMLPPSFDYNFDDDTSTIDFNFYSLTENRFVTLPQIQGLKDLMQKPIDDFTFCGSSHGWIAMFNSHTLDVFIYNPISLRHINLPSIYNLYKPINSRMFVKKIILSCSPDDDEQSCRAVMIYSCWNTAVFCCPDHSNEWVLIGHTYLDFVYSTRQNLFFGLSDSSKLETWDLTDPSSPYFVQMNDMDDGEDECSVNSRHFRFYGFMDELYEMKYLVVANGVFWDDILLVTRYVIGGPDPNGSYDEYVSLRFHVPHITMGFVVDVYDQEEDVVSFDLCNLGGLAVFIGYCSDSVALPAKLFPELKSNSIYFTDQYMVSDTDKLWGGQDFGIFNLLENRTKRWCYDPCDLPNLIRIDPSPIWFFPRLPAAVEGF